MTQAPLHKALFSFHTERARELGLDAAVLLHFIEELWNLQRFTTASGQEVCRLDADASEWLAWLPFFSPAQFMVALEQLEHHQWVRLQKHGERIAVSTPDTNALTDSTLEEDLAPPLAAPTLLSDHTPNHHTAQASPYDGSNPARLLNQTGDALWATAPSTQENNGAGSNHATSKTSAQSTTRKRCRIDTQWQPSGHCIELVQARGIEWEFAMAQREGFVLYYIDSGQMSTSWDSKFLDWVNRRWQYHLNDRQHGTQTHTTTGARSNDIASERAPRERKQQLRQRLRDIGDLDW